MNACIERGWGWGRGGGEGEGGDGKFGAVTCDGRVGDKGRPVLDVEGDLGGGDEAEDAIDLLGGD